MDANTIRDLVIKTRVEEESRLIALAATDDYVESIVISAVALGKQFESAWLKHGEPSILEKLQQVAPPALSAPELVSHE